tara:strand:- start:17995 stop:18786 length:792 start_codon:yes stop_codon:yes gene_type:complete
MTSFGYNINGFGVSGGGGTATFVTQALINSQENYNTVVASDFVGSGGTLIIPSGFWVFGTSTALTVDVADVTIENYGKVVGRAKGISIGASGVTINNYSGAFIAGGGGNGLQGATGEPGFGAGSSDPTTYLNQTGPDSLQVSTGGGYGGGAGGGSAGVSVWAGAFLNRTAGQGGWILPGVGGAGAGSFAGDGGSAGNVGGNGTHYGTDPTLGPFNGGGGGGGWGAYGGNAGMGGTGAQGSPAIFPNGNTYTLSNSGTIYGSTT